MLTTTGLLSLYIHDSLTFDGTELCLNPDLFTSSSTSAVGGDVAHSSVPRSRTNTFGGGDNASVSSVNNVDPSTGTIDHDSVNSASQQNTTQTTMSIQVGDMVEIRVWDPLPKEATTTTAASAGGGGSTAARSPTSSTGSGSRKQYNSTASVPTTSVSRSAPTTPAGGAVRHSISVNVNQDHGKPYGSSQETTQIRPRTTSFTTADSASGDKTKATHTVASLHHPLNSTSINSKPTTGDVRPSLSYDTASSISPVVTRTVATGPSATQQLPPVFPRPTATRHSSASNLQDVPNAANNSSSTAGSSIGATPTTTMPSSTTGVLGGGTTSDKDGNNNDKTPTRRPSGLHRRVASVPNERTTLSSEQQQHKPSVSSLIGGHGTTKDVMDVPRPHPTALFHNKPKPGQSNVSNTMISPRTTATGGGGGGGVGGGHFRDVSDMTVDILDGVAANTSAPAGASSSAGIVPMVSPIAMGSQDDQHQQPVPPPPSIAAASAASMAAIASGDAPISIGADNITGESVTATAGATASTTTAGPQPTSVDAWSKISSTHRLRLSFVVKVTERTLTSFKQGNTRTQISMLRQVADLYSLSMYDMVTVHKIESSDEEEVLSAVSADFVVVTIKDQFISRGDMMLFQDKLLGTWIYEGQRLTEPTRGIKAHAREIRHGNFSAKSGIVTDKTMITFRSRSARIIWLVQLSLEMWEYASPYEQPHENESVCEIYFDQWIRFLYKLFTKWKELEVTHSLTIIFFSRTFLSGGLKSSVGYQDAYGRQFEDHYKPVIENETCADWESLVVRIKEEFIKYPLEVGWNLKNRKPSSASQGNVLEAINVTLNLMQFHYLDRDLHRTGQSIVLVSPGCGVFEVDKGLAGITYQRMMDNGIGSDMLSLGLPPLHIAPFFLYNNDYQKVETEGVDTNETYYEVPHWMHLSFVSYDRPEEKRVYLSGLEETTSAPVQASWWLDSYELGPNGFAIPRFQQNDMVTTSKNKSYGSPTSSFSAAGNLAATPGKARVVQERGQATDRQLITGRSFRDILEASRPRVLGASSIPSALESILNLRKEAKVKGDEGNDWSTELAKERSSRKTGNLREWGTVDFQDFPSGGASKSSRGSSPSPSMLRGSAVAFGRTNSIEASQSSDEMSTSSRYTESPVSSHYGTSYDRLFWEYYEAPKLSKKALQLQRSPSLEFEANETKAGVDSFEGEDSISLGTDAASKGSFGADSDTNDSQKTKSMKRIDSLQRFMDKYDGVISGSSIAADRSGPSDKPQWSESFAAGDPSDPFSKPKDVPTTTQSGRQIRNDSQRSSPGLLGAALSQFQPSMTEVVSGQSDNVSSVLKRRSSGGNLMLSSDSRGLSFSSERRRAASPLPALSTLFQQPQDKIFSPKSHAHALASQQTDPPIIDRPQPNRHIISRDMSSSGFSTDSVGLNQPMSTIHPSGSSFGRNMLLSSGSSLTVGQYDSGRQTIKSISKSPPSTATPVTDNSRAPIRSPIKMLSSSPPKLAIPRQESAPGKSLGKSPPKSGLLLTREKAAPPRAGSREKSGGSTKHSLSSSRKKAFNPFRQSDEDEVLAKRSHNRRRWSHVFPAGEVEFKRHAGPIWNSLTSPAILPLSVDFFPTPQDLKDKNNFQFNFYQVTLSGIENNSYATHAELLLEMVRQRVTQDFQIVTPQAIAESERRAAESIREARNAGKSRSSRRASIKKALPIVKHGRSGTIQHHLSMGHRIQILSYNPVSDSIDILVYSRTGAQNDRMNVYDYKFLLFSKMTEQYTKSIQTFKKYADPYTWNRVDNLICGEEDRTMDIGMRFRRVMYGLIPESFKDTASEEQYVMKFKRLLEYLERLREKDGSTSALKVKIVTSADKTENDTNETPRGRDMTDSMIRFTVQLLRGKKDTFEWVEVAINRTFDTSKSYRIMFNWLVASSAKVENQLNLLQRRCTQFGLKLISFPQTTVSWSLYLHALAVPTFLCIRDKKKAEGVDETLSRLDFVYDGITLTEPQFLECIDDSKDYHFPTLRSGTIKKLSSPQYVHRSGALFIRKLTDEDGKVILAGIENYRHASVENQFRYIAKGIIKDLKDSIM